MSKPKLAFLIPNFDGGGAEAVIIRLANEFARRGFETELLAFRPEGENAIHVSPAVRVVDLGVRQFLAAPWAIRRYLRAEQPAVLTCALYAANVAALTAKLLTPFGKTRVIVTERTALSVQVAFSKRWSRHVFKPVARLLYRFADAVVGISRGVAEDIAGIARLPPGRVSFIYNPAVSPESVALAEAPLSWSLIPQSDEPVLISAGRFEPQKDQATLLRAFALLQQRVPSRLVLLGQGSLQGELEELARELEIRERVLFAGYLENPLPHVKDADLFVLSSRTEGFGNALVEAMACGTPVVSTDCPFGPGEILEGGEHGRLVPVGDAPGLAEAMFETLRTPQEAERLRRRAAEFSLDRCADRFQELFNELAPE